MTDTSNMNIEQIRELVAELESKIEILLEGDRRLEEKYQELKRKYIELEKTKQSE